MIAGVTSQITDQSNEEEKNRIEIRKKFLGSFFFYSFLYSFFQRNDRSVDKRGKSTVRCCLHSCFFTSLFSDPTFIILFSFCSGRDGGMAAQDIHRVSSGFISSLVLRGRRRTGRFTLENKGTQ